MVIPIPVLGTCVCTRSGATWIGLFLPLFLSPLVTADSPVPQIGHRGTCTGTSVNECAGDLQCVGGRCACDQTVTFWDGQGCQARKGHQVPCDHSSVDECLPGMLCTTYFFLLGSLDEFCLCYEDHFWHSNQCRSVTDWEPTLEVSKTSTTVTFNWSANRYNLPVEYSIQWENHGVHKVPMKDGDNPFTVESLSPSTEYLFKFESRMEENSFYPPRRAEKTVSVTTTSSKVKDLTIVQYAAGSATVSWTAPSDLNGGIRAFVVLVLNGDSLVCLQAYILMCADCVNRTYPAVPGCPPSKTTHGFKTDHVEGSHGHTFTCQITELSPYTGYRVTVFAHYDFGNGEEICRVFTTHEGGANSIESIHVTPGRDDTSFQVFLNVVLMPGDHTGETNFTVILKDFETKSVVSTQHLVGYSSTNVRFPDLKAYHRYRVAAFAETEVGTSPDTTQSEVVRTLVSKTGTARNVMVHPDGIVATKFTLTLDCPPEEDRNGTILRASVKKSTLGESHTDTFSFRISQTCQLSIQSEDLGSFTVLQNYSFSVTVHNDMFESLPSRDVYFYASPKAPIFGHDEDLVTLSSVIVASDSIIQATVCVDCLTNASQGEIIMAGLIVCVKSEGYLCDESGRTKRSTANADYWRNYTTWAQSAADDLRIPYRATPDTWLLDQPSSSFTIGSDTNCPRGPSITSHCNGPLPPGKEVVVTALSCTVGGCTLGQASVASDDDGDSDDAGVIAGVVVGAVAVFVVIVIIAVVVYRKRRSPRQCIIRQRSIKERRPIPITNFKTVVSQLHRNANLLFKKEFEDIKALDGHVNACYSNSHKNSNGITPNGFHDNLSQGQNHTELQLQEINGNKFDFDIDTSYVPGLSSAREYIACQRPDQDTVSRFWRMVWNNGSRAIVMLAGLMDDTESATSWPSGFNTSVDYEGIVVEMIASTQHQQGKTLARTFRLSIGGQTTEVTHFSISRWWDAGTGLSYKDSIDFINLVRREASCPNAGPMVVHGGQGVDWSGTFIALDYFTQYIDQHGLGASLDVFGHVLDMQRARPRVVIAENQYIYIHDALCHVIEVRLNTQDQLPRGMYTGKPVDGHLYTNITMSDTDTDTPNGMAVGNISTEF